MLNHTPPPSLSIFILAGLLLTAVSHAKPSEDYPHAFDVRNDVLIAQYDSKPDPDDLHAQIALGCMLQAPELKGIEVYAVMGAYGKQGGDNPYSPEFRADKRLFDYAFGEEDVAWTNAHPKYEDATWYASAQWIFDRVKPVLLKGGRVWVAEAGQSDFTREWVEMLVLDSEISEVAIKDRVVVVQHSIWNHQNTTVEDLLYVDQYATYFGPDQFNADRADLVRVDRMVIFNGNWQFRSALTDWLEDATHPNNPNVYARDAWILADDAAKIVLENAGNTAMAEGGVDFSDTIEAIWILDYDAIYEDRQNPFKFWKAFVVNHPPEAMASEDFSNGFGLFVDGSASAGLASIEDGSAENALSSRALRLGGSAAGEPLAMLSSSLDASASVRAMIEFDYYMSGFEADDRFLVEYYNGAEWVVAGDYSISGDFEEGVVRRGERLLVEGPFPTDFNVRFRSLVNGANDLIFIDNVVISSIAPPFESVEEKAPYGNNGNPWPVPGRVQAENYDFGGLNVSYYDESGVNSGGAARKLEGVYLAQSSDIDASLNVGRIRDGEWLEYTVEVAQADSYRVDFRVASPDGRGAIALSVDGQTIGEIVDIPVTDGWQSFQTVSMEEVPLSSGRQVIRVTFPKGNLNLNWWEVVSNDPDAETGNPGLYTERGGLVIMEAENTDSTLGMWELVNPTDSRYVNDAANELHLEFTGNTISNGPPNSPLSYTFEISQSGVYQLHIRGRKRLEGARDDQCNDAYVRMIGDFESGGGFPISTLTQNTKMYLSGGANKWSWAKQMEAHLGGFTRHGRVFYDFKAGETYTLVVSGRSKRFNVDRMILRHESVSEEIALDPQTPESIRPGDEASYRFEAISDFPSLNSGEAPYYMEEARGTLAINAANPANRGLFARAAKVFEGESGLYTFKLTTLTEEDGESIYRIRVNGAEVASFQNPYIGPGSDLDLKSNAFISELIPLNQGDTIWIESNTDTNGEVPEGEGTAWARGRWSQVELFLFSQEVPGTIEIPSRLAEGQGLFSPFELATDSGGVDYIATPESGALKNDLAVIESSGFASYRFEATADTDVTLRARVAAPSESSNSFWFRLNAGPWQLCSHDNREWAWVNLLEGSTTIETGVHTLEIAQRAAGARISAVRVQSSDPVLSAIYPTYGNEGTPGSGDAWVVSDSATTRIEAENYNRGGAGNAYLDADPENRGGQYRDDEVDVGKTSGGDYFVNFTGAIEWLDYTVDVVDPGVYQLVVSGARGWNGSANLNVLFDGENKAGELLIGSTGDFQNFAEVVAEVTLDSGIQTMRLDFASGGQNIDWVELRPVGLKQPWESSDVGSVALGGSANSIGSLFNLTASGADIYGRADEFQFVFQPMQGDGQIIARVDSLVNTNQWAKAGLMMRERLDANSKNVLVATTPANRLTFQSRSAEAGLTQYMAVANPSVNAWLRLTRAGDRFTADYSTDGIDWTPLNEAVIPMEEVIYIGMAATSHNNNALTTANFSQVSLSIETPGMDADGDGMPDAWELAMLGGTGFDPHRDEDGDGFTNLEEYTSGTDPMDGNARLRMKKISAPTAENGLTIRWDSAAGRHYRILVKEDLSSPDPWVPLSADLEGTGNEMSLTDPDTSMPKKFYKLEVWVP